MIILFLATAIANTPQVYEFCRIENQKWSERYQKFEMQHFSTFYTFQKPQMIVYEKSFELARDEHPIVETYQKNGMNCWREHANSELCYDKRRKQVLWEWNTRAGDTFRKVMDVCRVNGE